MTMSIADKFYSTKEVNKTFTIEEITELYKKEQNVTRLVYRYLLLMQSGCDYKSKYAMLCEKSVKRMAIDIVGMKTCYYSEGKFVNTNKYNNFIKECDEAILHLEQIGYIVINKANTTWGFTQIKVIK